MGEEVDYVLLMPCIRHRQLGVTRQAQPVSVQDGSEPYSKSHSESCSKPISEPDSESYAEPHSEFPSEPDFESYSEPESECIRAGAGLPNLVHLADARWPSIAIRGEDSQRRLWSLAMLPRKHTRTPRLSC